MKRAAIYIRCTEDSPIQEFQDEIKERIERQDGWQFAGAYVDIGYSGSNRPASRKLIAECEAGNVEIIVIRHYATLARRVEDSLRLLGMLQKTGAAIYQCTLDALEPISSDPAVEAVTEQMRAMRREANKRYEEKHKAERKAKNATFGTSMPREQVEQIQAFLKKYGYTKVDLIEAGYRALLDAAAEHDLSLGKIMDGYDDFFGTELEQMKKTE